MIIEMALFSWYVRDIATNELQKVMNAPVRDLDYR